MLTVRRTAEFNTWLRSLRDDRARARIAQRLLRLEEGNFGDMDRFHGVGELRIHYGPGYRLYFCQRGQEVVILLCGGDKQSQDRDIKRARELAQEV